MQIAHAHHTHGSFAANHSKSAANAKTNKHAAFGTMLNQMQAASHTPTAKTETAHPKPNYAAIMSDVEEKIKAEICKKAAEQQEAASQEAEQPKPGNNSQAVADWVSENTDKIYDRDGLLSQGGQGFYFCDYDPRRSEEPPAVDGETGCIWMSKGTQKDTGESYVMRAYLDGSIWTTYSDGRKVKEEYNRDDKRFIGLPFTLNGEFGLIMESHGTREDTGESYVTKQYMDGSVWTTYADGRKVKEKYYVHGEFIRFTPGLSDGCMWAPYKINGKSLKEMEEDLRKAAEASRPPIETKAPSKIIEHKNIREMLLAVLAKSGITLADYEKFDIKVDKYFNVTVTGDDKEKAKAMEKIFNSAEGENWGLLLLQYMEYMESDLPDGTEEYAAKMNKMFLENYLINASGGSVSLNDLYLLPDGKIAGLPPELDNLINSMEPSYFGQTRQEIEKEARETYDLLKGFSPSHKFTTDDEQRAFDAGDKEGFVKAHFERVMQNPKSFNLKAALTEILKTGVNNIPDVSANMVLGSGGFVFG